MSCRLPPSRSRASSEASVLLFFWWRGGAWGGNVCGFRRDSACHLAPASVSCKADSHRRMALHEWDSRCNLGRGGPRPPAPTSARSPPARDNNPSRKLIEDDGRGGRSVDQPTILLLARFPVAVPQNPSTEQKNKRKRAEFAFYLAPDAGRRTTCTSHPESHLLSSVPPAAAHSPNSSPALRAQLALPCPSLFSIARTQKRGPKDASHPRPRAPANKDTTRPTAQPCRGSFGRRVDDLSTVDKSMMGRGGERRRLARTGASR